MKRSNFVTAAVAAMLAIPAAQALALDVQPGDYIWVGAGHTLVLAYGQHQSANSFHLDGAGDVPESEMDANILILRAVHYREIAGQKFVFQMIAPMGKFDGVDIGGARQEVKDGFGDLTLGATWFPLASDDAYGTTLGLSAFVTAPTGAFDANRVSFGSGTWALTPQIGMVQGLGNGFFVDASVEASIYRDFHDSGVDFSRDTTVQGQAYVRYQYTDATAFSLGYTSKSGGELYANGSYTGQKTQSDQVRFVASTFITPTQQLQVMLAKDVDAKGGFKTEPLVQLRFGLVF